MQIPTIFRMLQCVTVMVILLQMTQGKPEDKVQEEGMTSAEYNYRIDRIKKDILRKLNMKSPPKPSLEREKIPAALMNEFLRDIKQREENVMKKSTKKIIALAQKAKMSSCGNEQCLKVAFNQSLRNYQVQALDIWMFKEASKTPPGVIKVDKMEKGKKSLLLEVSGGAAESGWVTSKVLDFKTKWMSGEGDDSMINLSLRISCKGCKLSESVKKLPFLVITTETTLNSRVRRHSGKCNSSKTCCLKTLEVDFKKLGWDEFIITPKTFDAKFCDGVCPTDHQWANEHMGLVRNVQKDFESCCNPEEYQPLDILYVEDGNIIQKNVPNMKVSKCRCA